MNNYIRFRKMAMDDPQKAMTELEQLEDPIQIATWLFFKPFGQQSISSILQSHGLTPSERLQRLVYSCRLYGEKEATKYVANSLLWNKKVQYIPSRMVLDAVKSPDLNRVLRTTVDANWIRLHRMNAKVVEAVRPFGKERILRSGYELTRHPSCKNCEYIPSRLLSSSELYEKTGILSGHYEHNLFALDNMGRITGLIKGVIENGWAIIYYIFSEKCGACMAYAFIKLARKEGARQVAIADPISEKVATRYKTWGFKERRRGKYGHDLLIFVDTDTPLLDESEFGQSDQSDFESDSDSEPESD